MFLRKEDKKKKVSFTFGIGIGGEYRPLERRTVEHDRKDESLWQQPASH